MCFIQKEIGGITHDSDAVTKKATHFYENLYASRENKIVKLDIGQSVNWCFEPSQPLGITSGLKETFIKRHTVERTSKVEIRPEEQNEKTESCRETLWNKKNGHKRETDTKTETKKEWASSVDLRL